MLVCSSVQGIRIRLYKVRNGKQPQGHSVVQKYTSDTKSQNGMSKQGIEQGNFSHFEDHTTELCQKSLLPLMSPKGDQWNQ